MAFPPSAKRFGISLILGTAAGLLCAWLAGHHQPELFHWQHPIFWTVVTDRMLMGIVIALAGAFTVHPILGFRFSPWLRGGCLGTMVSLPLATGALSGPPHPMMSPWAIFAATLVAGLVYGAVIDWIATRLGGEGKTLLAE